MTALLLRFYPGDELMWGAASVIVQIAGVVLAALTIARLLARHNPSLRHGIWLAALTWVFLAPVAAWVFTNAGLSLWKRPAAPVAQAHSPAAAPLPAHMKLSNAILKNAGKSPVQPTGGSPIAGPPRFAPPTIHSLIAIAGVIWVAGAAILLAQLIVGLFVIARLGRNALSADEALRGITASVRRTLGVDALPPIRFSCDVPGPATIGIARPVVVLPPALAHGMSDDELHDAIAHECAHALRHDHVIAIVQRVAAALFWPHPCVHLLNRQLSRAREEVCDNAVLAARRPADYARTLLSLTERIGEQFAAPALVAMLDRRWRLEQRIAGLLNPRRITMTRTHRFAAATIFAGMMLVGGALASLGASDRRAGDETSRPGAQSRAGTPDATARPNTGQSASRQPDWTDDAPASLPPGQQAAELKIKNAQLDLREAELILQNKRFKYDRERKLTGAVSNEELEQSKLDVDLAEIQLERARLRLEEAQARADAIKPTPVRVVIAQAGRTWVVSDQQPPRGVPSLKRLVSAQKQVLAKRGLDPARLRVALVHDADSAGEAWETASSDHNHWQSAAAVLNGTEGDRTVQSGDTVIITDVPPEPGRN